MRSPLFFALIGLFSATLAHAEDGITKDTIKIGATVALSGFAKEHGTALKAGAELYWSSINKNGGVNGRKIELQVLDDGFVPPRAFENTKKLIESEKVFAIVTSHGTPTSKAVMPYVSKTGVPFLFPIVGTEDFVKPVTPNVFVLRRLFPGEAESLTSVIGKLNIKEIGIFRDDAGLGSGGKAALEYALKEHGIKLSADASFALNSPDFNAAFKVLLDARPKAVVSWASSGQTLALLKKMKDANWMPVLLFASPSLANEVFDSLKSLGVKSAYFSANVPYITETKYEIVSQYLQAAKTAGQTPHIFALESYINSFIFHEALKRIQGEPTRAKLIEAIESMHGISVGGLPLSFSKTNHQGIDRNFLVEFKNGDIIAADPKTLAPL